MKIEDIEPGRKYWKTQTIGGGNGGRIKQNIAIYVLQVDQGKKKVLASINQAPAKWFAGNSVAYWTTEPQNT